MKKDYRVLVCDLDGTLITTMSGETFPKGIWDMKLRFDVLDAIKNLTPGQIFVATNQGGIEKGYVDAHRFQTKLSYVCDCMQDYLLGPKSRGWRIHSLSCDSNNPLNVMRKPNIGMMIQYIESVHNGVLDPAEVLMIGDASGKEGQFSDSDKKFAENFGCDYMDVEDFVKEYSTR